MSFTRRRTKKDAAPTASLRLEQLVGLTTTRSSQCAAHPFLAQVIAYTAGCTVVIYDHVANHQLGFLCADRTRYSVQELVQRRHQAAASLQPAMANPLPFLSPQLGGHFPTDLSAHFPDSTKATWRPIPPKTVSCIAFSPDGQYMVLGETGHQPRVLVFDWRTGSILAELLGHKFGVVAVRFSPDLCHVVSVGKHHDGFINVWDWRTGEKVGSNRATTKIHSLAFAPDGSFFVTVGIRHVKFWYFKDRDGASSKTLDQVAIVEGRSGILGDQRNNTFVEVVVLDQPATPHDAPPGLREPPQGPAPPTLRKSRPGSSGRSDSGSEGDVGRGVPCVYALTGSGVLCLFGQAQRTLNKWVDTRIPRATSLVANDRYLFCSGAGGLVRVFDILTLAYIVTLPVPARPSRRVRPALWHADGPVPPPPDDSLTDSTDSMEARAPTVLASCLTAPPGPSTRDQCLVAIDGDRSLRIWDLSPLPSGAVWPDAHLAFHQGCVWGVERLLHPSASPTLARSFLTFSSDETVRWWQLAGPCAAPSPDEVQPEWLLETLAVGAGDGLPSHMHPNLLPAALTGPLAGPSVFDETPPAPALPTSTKGIRSLRVSPDGRLIVMGDRRGHVHIYDIHCRIHLTSFEAHESEILALDITALSPSESCTPSRNCEYLLATASRDRLIHIFHLYSDGLYRWRHIQSLDDHSSSVVRVRFAERGLKIVSCSLDKSVMFRYRAKAIHHSTDLASFPPYTLLQHFHGRSTVNDFAVDHKEEYLYGVTQDRSLLVFNLQHGKLARTVRPDPNELVRAPPVVLTALPATDKSAPPTPASIPPGSSATATPPPLPPSAQNTPPTSRTSDRARRRSLATPSTSSSSGGLPATTSPLPPPLVAIAVPPPNRSPGSCFVKPGPTPDYGLTKIALNRSSSLAALAGSDKAVRLVDLATGQLVAAAYGPSEPITGITFSGPKDDRIVITAADGCVSVWALDLTPANAASPPTLDDSVRPVGWRTMSRKGSLVSLASSYHSRQSYDGSLPGDSATASFTDTLPGGDPPLPDFLNLPQEDDLFSESSSLHSFLDSEPTGSLDRSDPPHLTYHPRTPPRLLLQSSDGSLNHTADLYPVISLNTLVNQGRSTPSHASPKDPRATALRLGKAQPTANAISKRFGALKASRDPLSNAKSGSGRLSRAPYQALAAVLQATGDGQPRLPQGPALAAQPVPQAPGRDASPAPSSTPPRVQGHPDSPQGADACTPPRRLTSSTSQTITAQFRQYSLTRSPPYMFSPSGPFARPADTEDPPGAPAQDQPGSPLRRAKHALASLRTARDLLRTPPCPSDEGIAGIAPCPELASVHREIGGELAELMSLMGLSKGTALASPTRGVEPAPKPIEQSLHDYSEQLVALVARKLAAYNPRAASSQY